MYSVVIDQDTLHLKVCLLTIFLVFELDKGILETVPGAFVSNDLARDYWTETAEDSFQIFVLIEDEVSTALME